MLFSDKVETSIMTRALQRIFILFYVFYVFYVFLFYFMHKTDMVVLLVPAPSFSVKESIEFCSCKTKTT